MVTLPKGFVRTKFNGYFWHLEEKRLYSLKLGGVLRSLKYQKPNRFNNMIGGYSVSVNGRRRKLTDYYLNKLVLEDSEIPVLTILEKNNEQKFCRKTTQRQGGNSFDCVVHRPA